MFRPILVAAIIAIAGGAAAESSLASSLKEIARTQSGPVSGELKSVTYDEALYLLDELNHSDLRRLAAASFEGRITLPRSIRQALEVKAPRLNQRGAGR